MIFYRSGISASWIIRLMLIQSFLYLPFKITYILPSCSQKIITHANQHCEMISKWMTCRKFWKLLFVNYFFNRLFYATSLTDWSSSLSVIPFNATSMISLFTNFYIFLVACEKKERDYNNDGFFNLSYFWMVKVSSFGNFSIIWD